LRHSNWAEEFKNASEVKREGTGNGRSHKGEDNIEESITLIIRRQNRNNMTGKR